VVESRRFRLEQGRVSVRSPISGDHRGIFIDMAVTPEAVKVAFPDLEVDEAPLGSGTFKVAFLAIARFAEPVVALVVAHMNEIYFSLEGVSDSLDCADA
jgi:hypothetical protein